jgi:hypothetical protein
MDSFIEFFLCKIEEYGICDVDPIKTSPTWKNFMGAEDGISKILGRFVVLEKITSQYDITIYWVSSRRISNHIPILLQNDNGEEKPPGPFKFNPK